MESPPRSRKPQVRYFESRQAYFTQVAGKQHRLAVGEDDAPAGPTYLKALDAFKRLMERGNLETAGDANTVRAVCLTYMDAKAELRPTTSRMKKDKLGTFMRAYGDLPVNELKTHHAETLIAKMRRRRTIKQTIHDKTVTRTVRWSNSSVRQFLAQLKACFNWAVNNEYVSRNPFKGITPPQQTYRSRERIVTQDEHDKVLAHLKRASSQPVKRIVIALENTGARPGELTHARVCDFNAKLGAIVYHADEHRRQDEHAHKTSGKGKHRVIYFTGSCLEMVQELVRDKKPTDFIFTNSKGKPYANTNTLATVFANIADRLNLPHYMPYSYRHTLATKWLTQGKSIDKLAALLGNSPNTIRLHYSHLIHEHDALRADLEQFQEQQRVDSKNDPYENYLLRMRAAK